MDNCLIYIGDDKLIKNIDTKLKLKYFPLINKFGLDTKDISNRTILMYIIGYGFYAKFKILHIIDKYNKLYNQLLSCYKLCEISTLYFIQYCDINYFDNIITIKNYQEYCKKNNKVFKSLPKNIELMNVVSYNATIIDKLLIVVNDDITLSDELRNDAKGAEGDSDEDDEGSSDSTGDDGDSDSTGDDDESGSDGDEGSSNSNSDNDEGNGGSDNDEGSDSSSKEEEDTEGDINIIDGSVPILWIPCKKISINDYKNHIYKCKKCEFINNNNNICGKKNKIKVTIGKYDKLVDAYMCSSIYKYKKKLSKNTLTVVKIDNDKNFYNDCMFII
jgi:hypothetical protein